MVSNSISLKRLSLLFVFISTTAPTVYGGNLLFGLPIESPKANIHMEAVLIDVETNEEWLLSEDLAGASELHGKIRATHENKSLDIFYHEKYDDKRLVINDLECQRMDDQPSYWSRPTLDVHGKVKKMLILLGPSIIYRLKSLKWQNINEINGVINQMQVVLDKTLLITAFFRSNYTNESNKLARLNFTDISGPSIVDKKSSLVLDIVSQTIVKDNLDDRVEPTPGIGCPNYFHGDQNFPEFKTRQLHFAATELITNPSGTRKINLEVYVDSDKKVTRIDMDQDYTINDFNLAVSYIFNHGKCTIASFSEKIEGLIGGQLNINELLWTNGQVDKYKYVGKTVYEPRAQGVFDTWESIEYGRIIDGVKFDKVVTTQYMAKLSGLSEIKTSSNYIPVAIIRVGYNKDSMGKYQVHESRRRDILEFQRAISQSQYQKLFQITDCFDLQERKYLSFDIRSENHDYSCNFVTQRAEENIHEFKKSFKTLLTKNISPLRISSMTFNFQSDKISSTVEFLEKPALEKSFKKQDIQLKVGSKMIVHSDAIPTKSLDECLKTQVANSFFREILHCPSADGLCVQFDKSVNQTQDNTDPLTACSLYTFPLTSKWRLTKEIELPNLHKELLRTENMIFSMPCINCSIPDEVLKYRVINVYDFKYSDNPSKQPKFTEIHKSRKLDPKMQSVQIVKGPIRDFTDCYNSCASSRNCATFTHCTSEASHECYSTNELYTENSTVFHPNCTTYARDYLIEYQKTPAREYLGSNRRENLYSVSAADCASFCHRSNICLTFQYCGNNVCSLAGPYTSRITQPNSNCDIYVPKKSHEFILTGESLVNQVISTVGGLNLEQCAALCFDWKYGNESCTSFNYCPTSRSESTCALTKYSVSEPTVETTASNFCFNFELIKSRPKKQKEHPFQLNDDIGNAGTSISLAFLVVGLALGVAITSMYHTFHNRHKYRVTSADQYSNE